MAFVNLSKNITTMIVLKVVATFCLATFCLVSAATLTENELKLELPKLELLKDTGTGGLTKFNGLIAKAVESKSKPEKYWPYWPNGTIISVESKQTFGNSR